jgi:hypothetical protein
MSEWKINRRETSLIEHVCEHGIGHPNFYSAYRMAKLYGDHISSWQIHGCDGCCGEDDFPGHEMAQFELVKRSYDEILDAKDSDNFEFLLWQWISFAVHDATINGELNGR